MGQWRFSHGPPQGAECGIAICRVRVINRGERSRDRAPLRDRVGSEKCSKIASRNVTFSPIWGRRSGGHGISPTETVPASIFSSKGLCVSTSISFSEIVMQLFAKM